MYIPKALCRLSWMSLCVSWHCATHHGRGESWISWEWAHLQDVVIKCCYWKNEPYCVLNYWTNHELQENRWTFVYSFALEQQQIVNFRIFYTMERVARYHTGHPGYGYSCQTDQYHVTMYRVFRSRKFLKFTAAQALVLGWISGSP